jgi:hypothetical protein
MFMARKFPKASQQYPSKHEILNENGREQCTVIPPCYDKQEA